MRDDLTPAGIIIEFNQIQQDIEQAQSMAEIKNAMKRHAERMELITDWSKPDAITERLAKIAEGAIAALEAGKRAARGLEDIPLPDPLPKHMRGQSLSTIKAMLRHEKESK